MTSFSDPIYHDEDAARAHIEALRWPDGPYCPLCGSFDKVAALGGKSMGPGWYHCGVCRRKFTVRTGSVYERSHIPLHKWLYATALMASSKKGISAHQIHRMLGIGYRAAWFMCHRIREAMRDDKPTPMGGAFKTVQADETYFGRLEIAPNQRADGKPFIKHRPKGGANKRAIVSLVEPGGKARSFHVESANIENVRKILKENVRWQTVLHTDESRLYTRTGAEFLRHETVNHGRGEYVSRTTGATTNNVENYFSVFKRGMKGVYQHCSEKHLQRYLDEFDFRYNRRSGLGVTDAERAAAAVKGTEGKRLLYRVS